MDLYISRFWGFRPEAYPAITFSSATFRDKLLAESSPGDRIVFAATKTENTAEDERGRLRGMAEISRRAVDTVSLLDVEGMPPELFHNGKLRFPKALPMVRAWRFPDPPFLTDVLERQLPRSATSGAIILSEQDVAAVMALDTNVVDLPETDALRRERTIADNLADLSPSRGPGPTSGERSYEAGERDFGHVYGLQFGERGVWKVGNSYDPHKRADAFNANIPSAVTGEEWRVVWTQKTGSPKQAYDLEQEVIKRLSEFSIGGEMFRCSKKQFERTWTDVVIAGVLGGDG